MYILITDPSTQRRYAIEIEPDELGSVVHDQKIWWRRMIRQQQKQIDLDELAIKHHILYNTLQDKEFDKQYIKEYLDLIYEARTKIDELEELVSGKGESRLKRDVGIILD